MEELNWGPNSEFNKRKCVTQISAGRVDATTDPEDEDTTKFTSHFAFPFDYQMLLNRKID
jgi:hypothetical protein